MSSVTFPTQLSHEPRVWLLYEGGLTDVSDNRDVADVLGMDGHCIVRASIVRIRS